MRIRLFPAVALALSLGLAACSHPPTQQDAGMVIGGALGGILGQTVGRGSGRTAATIIGTLVGATIGGSVGQSMDETDRLKTGLALENVRTGVSSAWRNPDTGSEYNVTSRRTYESAGSPCREYTVDAVIGGKTQQVYGTACRQADGSWRTQP